MIQGQRALIKMPEVVGLPLRKAKLLLENSGLRIDGVLYQESYEERNTVLEQKPLRGQMVYVGEKVTLTVTRESYIKWLPSIYQRSDALGRNFLRDMLWIVQHLFGEIEERLDLIHQYFDPLESPEEFVPWLAGWTAMILEEDWPLEKKRKLIKKAIELYKVRGTVKGLKLFISLFTGHEPEIIENNWPFRGFQIGVTSGIGIDTVILPPVNLAHTFVVEMPMAYRDISVESVIRLHEIIHMEKPANTSYYLRFLAEDRPRELREFFAIAVRSGIGIGQEVITPLPAGGIDVIERLDHEEAQRHRDMKPADMPAEESVDEFIAPQPGKPPLPKAPRADEAPVEGQEVRTNLAGGFEGAAREIDVSEIERLLKARDEEDARSKPSGGDTPADGDDATVVQSSDDSTKGPGGKKPRKKK